MVFFKTISMVTQSRLDSQRSEERVDYLFHVEAKAGKH
uniref:Uncharacterized protein n=1 Tax=Tetranychus urticae TaxID=32264 RepID=T1K914_TETUR